MLSIILIGHNLCPATRMPLRQKEFKYGHCLLTLFKFFGRINKFVLTVSYCDSLTNSNE